MKKIWKAILDFWYYKVTNTRQKSVEVGGFKITFYKYFMKVKAIGGAWETKIRCDAYSYGYLATSLKQGNLENLKGYSQVAFLVATELCKDFKLANEVQRALERYIGRQEKIAQINGLKAEENGEADLEAVKSATMMEGMSRAQRHQRIRELRKEMKKEVKNGTNE